VLAREGGEGDRLLLGEPAQGDRVDLDRADAGLGREGLEPAQDLRQRVARVISKKRSCCSESMETLKRLMPASTSAAASRSSRKPFVVTARSSSSGTAARAAARRGNSRRTSGSPPVRRTERMPICASRRTTRSISSNDRTAARSSHGSPSAGMQYWQRKLQRSVTDTAGRRSCGRARR
jgi:hypothetical protein